MSDLDVRVLGPFELFRDGTPVALTSNRLRALLAMLATSAGDFVSVEALGTAVWGPASPANLRSSLQTYVARLRRAIGDDAIATSPGGYRLVLDPARVDALRFLRLAAVPPGRPGERDALVEALRLWRGTPFQGVDSDWLAQSEAVRLTEAYLDVLERRADLDLSAGRAADSLADLRAASVRHPLREPLWARLILVLDAAGRREDAEAAYEEVKERLVDELGSDPGPVLRQAHAKLVAAVAPGTEVPRQLPSDITGFTGRADVLNELGRASEGVVVLHGTGGVGKTAVAVHWAHGGEFPDGALFVNLRGYGPGAPVPPGVALDGMLRALGVDGRQIPAEVDGRTALLRERLDGRRALLLLDNAREAEQVRPLLPGGHNLVVVTSRSTLRELTGVRRIAVGELTPHEATELLGTNLRLGHAGPERNELAELCGRLPLALAVAAEHAGRHAGTELGELVAELRDRHDRLDALEVAGDPASSVRTVFSWSVETLDPDTLRAFQLLGLHPAPDLAVPAAAALFGTTVDRSQRLLDQLVDAHLVEQRRPGRYQLHDLIQIYAAELAGALHAADRTDALDRVFGWYVHTVANARTAIGRGRSLGETGELPAGVTPLTFADEREAFGWFDTERVTLVAVVETASELGHAAAHRVAEQMSSYLLVRYAVDDLFRTQRIAVEVARRTGDGVAEAVARNKLGSAYRVIGDYEQSRLLQEQAVELFAELGHRRGRVSAMVNLGTALQALGDEDGALDRHELALALARELGDNDEVVLALNNLAMSYLHFKRYAESVDACRQALALPRSPAFHFAEPHMWDSLGQALTATGDYDEAIDAYHRSLAMVRELGDRWGESIVLSNLGNALYAAGRPAEAGPSWRQALALMDAHGIADGHEVSRTGLLDQLALLDPE